MKDIVPLGKCCLTLQFMKAAKKTVSGPTIKKWKGGGARPEHKKRFHGTTRRGGVGGVKGLVFVQHQNKLRLPLKEK